MPGLYKSKRKRPTMNSSFQNDDSVWHSTPVDSSGGGAALSTGAPDERDEEEEDEEMLALVSPVKRPALGAGVRVRLEGYTAVTATPGTLAGGGPRDTSSSPGPSSFSVIQTPAAAANVVQLESGDEDDLFEDMDAPPPPAQEGPRPGTIVDNSFHSRRYGEVHIHPPIGSKYFAMILQKNGFLLTLPRNHLLHDVRVFRNNLEKWMKENSDENSRIEDGATKFSAAVKKFFSSKESLSHACTTTLNDTECIQPSLLQSMLGVPLLQKSLLEVVLPALSEASFSNAQDEVDFVNTIVNQMKWLPMIVDGNGFADSLLSILDVASLASKKHIIRLLPEIFLPEYHPTLVPKLMEIFDAGDGTAINVAMLDCLSCLVVPEEDCLRIRRSAVDRMSAAPLEDLPAYLSFLFRVESTQAQLEEGIREMREKLEIKSKFQLNRIGKEDALQVEILERMRFFVSVNPLLIKTWLSQVKIDLSMEIELPTLDLLMLLVFVESRNKPATNILTTLFGRPVLANLLIDKMMENNNQMLHELFPTVARFLDGILRTRNSKCHEAAIGITKKLFVGLGPILSQHLTSNLIGVLINGHPTCRDVVLKIFTSIAETDAPKLLYFHAYLMGALVYVIQFPPRQMEALMNILAILAYMPENHQGEENAFTAEFMILLRKQITHTNPRTRCFGVLGIVAAVRQLALHSSENCDNEGKIDVLLALAWSSIENDEEACSIFFDELISCINLLPKEVCIQFREIVKLQFQRLWTLDQESSSLVLESGRGQADLHLVPTFDANKEVVEQEKIIIVLEPRALQMNPLVVPSMFRVMAELENVSENGDLEGIDAVLGCPIFFPKVSEYYEKDVDTISVLNYNSRYHLGQYLIIAINYFRECVSAFVQSDNPELIVKVWMRLNSIILLQKSLVKHYESFPNLPSAYGTEKTMIDNSGAGFSGNLMAGRGATKKKTTKPKAPKKKGKKKKKKTNNDDEEEDEESDVQLDSDDDDFLVTKETKSLNLEEDIQPKYISANLRRLDPKVFKMLQFPFMLASDPIDYSDILHNLSGATQSTDTMRRIQQFNSDTLVLLLTEINKQATDKKLNFKILKVENLWNNLCGHIDTISELYSYDENEEPPANHHRIDSCLRLLLSVMNLYLEAVSKEEKSSKVKLLDAIVLSLATRHTAENQNQEDEDMDEENSSQERLLDKVSNYLSSMSSTIGPTDPTIAQVHVKLMKAMHDLLPQPEKIKKSLENVIKSYLQRKWKLPSSVISYFLTTWFAVSPKPMKVVRQLVEALIGDVEKGLEINGIPNSTIYKSCTKFNFHTWYGGIFAGLVHHVVKMGRRRTEFEEAIQLWSEGNGLLKTLTIVSQHLKKSSILLPLIKFSRLYIDAFVSGGACHMPELWKRDFDKGQKFSKTLSFSTIKMDAICQYCKVMKDNVLLRHVPILKKSLEALLFKIREVLSSKGAADAFSVGELKHTDLEGQIIHSQPFCEMEFSDSEAESGGVPEDNENDEEQGQDEEADDDEEMTNYDDSD